MNIENTALEKIQHTLDDIEDVLWDMSRDKSSAVQWALIGVLVSPVLLWGAQWIARHLQRDVSRGEES